MLNSATGWRDLSWSRDSQAVGVARQIARQAARGRRLPPVHPRPTLAAALTCAAYAALGAVVWAAYGQLGLDAKLARPPLVSAAATPVKLTAATVGQPEPARTLDDQTGRHARATREALRGAVSGPLSSPRADQRPALSPAPSPADVSEAAADAGRPATSDARPAPAAPAAPSSMTAAPPLPVLKPPAGITVMAAAEPAITAPPAQPVEAAASEAGAAPPLPALKPAARLPPAAARAIDACGAAAVGHGVLPPGCDVRLAEAPDPGFLASFWSGLKDLFASGSRSALVAANDGGRDPGIGLSHPGAGSDPASETGSDGADRSGAGPAGDNPAGAGATGAGSVGGTVGSVGASVGGLRASAASVGVSATRSATTARASAATAMAAAGGTAVAAEETVVAVEETAAAVEETAAAMAMAAVATAMAAVATAMAAAATAMATSERLAGDPPAV